MRLIWDIFNFKITFHYEYPSFPTSIGNLDVYRLIRVDPLIKPEGDDFSSIEFFRNISKRILK